MAVILAAGSEDVKRVSLPSGELMSRHTFKRKALSVNPESLCSLINLRGHLDADLPHHYTPDGYFAYYNASVVYSVPK
jgi:hypothetical protein